MNRNILDFMSKIQEFYCIEERNLNENFLNFRTTKNFFINADINHENYVSVYYIINGKLSQRLNEIKELKKFYLFIKINNREKYINVLINRNENINSNGILSKINNINAMRSAIIANLNIEEFPLINYFMYEKNIINNSVNEKIFDKIYEIRNLNDIPRPIDYAKYNYNNTNTNYNNNINNNNMNFNDQKVIKETKIEDLENLLYIEKNKNKELNLKNKELYLKIDKLEKILNENKKEIEELKEKLSRYPFELLPGEKMICIFFISTSHDIQYSVICKNTDIFVNLELKLYREYPKYSENENYFTVNGNKINKYKSLEENKIKDNDIILLNQVE